MSATKDGGPAFPCEFKTWNCSAPPGEIGEMIEGSISFQGMSLRYYFAAKALQGLLCNPEMRRDWGPQEWAEESYRHADAMLAAGEAK